MCVKMIKKISSVFNYNKESNQEVKCPPKKIELNLLQETITSYVLFEITDIIVKPV